MSEKNWLIYGANGYTGRLIAEKAKRLGMTPIVAGRNRAEVEALGARLNLPTRVFPCTSEYEIAKFLDGIALVLHCAGPFSATSSPMVKACMSAKAHYLDITGEIEVFEKIHAHSMEIAKAGIVAIPGVGFDVVPSDCLAAMLKAEMPDAIELELILKPSGGVSPGTMKTMIEGLNNGTAIRHNGKIEIVNGLSMEQRNFNGKIRDVMGIAWGDVSTAFYSTGIPNIKVFMVSKRAQMRALKVIQKFRVIFSSSPVQRLLKKTVDIFVQGPDENRREQSGYQIWGLVRNRAGETLEMGISTTNGYTFTVDAALASVERVMKGNISAGATTPSKAFGSDFVLSLPGIQLIEAKN